ncbi:MAG: hypothetical protein AABZ06_13490 [Bdellovibrionota bacterium]
MSLDSDIGLVGTGVAPLVAARHLVTQGYSVLLLNPDTDFFLEDSELSLDPLWPMDKNTVSLDRLLSCSAERAVDELRPSFPGMVEVWSGSSGIAESADYHDPDAPHVRQRSRLWIAPRENNQSTNKEYWASIEEMYVEVFDRGLNPKTLEGLLAARRFPGFSLQSDRISQKTENLRGVQIPKFSDVDVTRYRNGILGFVRERLGPDRVVCGATQIEIIPEGIRFHARGVPRTARLKEGALIFWTPRLTNWILAESKRWEAKPVMPRGLRFFEQWSIMSREPLDCTVIGTYGDLTAWAEVEGTPSSEQTRLAVLRAGELRAVGVENVLELGLDWASADSFNVLAGFCNDFLNWERFSIRAMRPKAIFEWKNNNLSWSLGQLGQHGRFGKISHKVKVIGGCDGPLVNVVGRARAACEDIEKWRSA